MTFAFKFSLAIAHHHTRIPVVDTSLTVIFDIGFKLAATASILILQNSLEPHILRLFGAQRLYLGESVLPVELPTLLFPIIVSLHLFLLPIVFLNLSYLINRVLALFFRFFRQLYEFLNFSPDCLILFVDGVT